MTLVEGYTTLEQPYEAPRKSLRDLGVGMGRLGLGPSKLPDC